MRIVIRVENALKKRNTKRNKKLTWFDIKIYVYIEKFYVNTCFIYRDSKCECLR